MRLNWKPSHVFYGWWIVGASFLIALYVGGVVFYGFTTIFEPIAHELGWSYTQISFAASLRGLEMGNGGKFCHDGFWVALFRICLHGGHMADCTFSHSFWYRLWRL